MTEAEGNRVSTLELFFDLVFVFTITQVALVVEHHPSWRAAGQALIELAVIYWMYGGYAWLTNTLGTRTQRQRIVLLLGMAAFLGVSLAVPRAFEGDGVAFGWAYLLLNAVHLAGFVIGDVPDAGAAIRRLGSINLTAAGLLLAAGYLGGHWRWPMWIAAVLIQWGVALGARVSSSFTVDVGHFAERHGLMIIIVLGESVVSVALAAQEAPVTVRLAVGVLCGLAASAAMWWCYFAGDDERAAAAFDRLEPRRRGSVALRGYDLTHVFMLAGVVAVAAGSRHALPDLTAATDLAAATLIAGGLAAYLLALAAFRAIVRFANPVPRLAAAVAMPASIPIGTALGAAQQLLAAAAAIAVLLVVERRLTAPSVVRSPDPAG
jgi:low temperature requirement protein LtrA